MSVSAVLAATLSEARAWVGRGNVPTDAVPLSTSQRPAALQGRRLDVLFVAPGWTRGRGAVGAVQLLARDVRKSAGDIRETEV